MTLEIVGEGLVKDGGLVDLDGGAGGFATSIIFYLYKFTFYRLTCLIDNLQETITAYRYSTNSRVKQFMVDGVPNASVSTKRNQHIQVLLAH